MTLLIIEPDRILARQYQKALERAGFKIKLCSNAQKAIAIIDKEPPAAIIMEIQLAGHSGIEFLHEFRTYEDWSVIPVFILSAVPEYALGTDDKTWSSFGVSRYFYKPQTSLVQLVGAIKGALL
jgi:DNA-binding response OmpR family regulator